MNLKKELEKGRLFNVILLADPKNWSCMKEVEDHFKNFKVQYFDQATGELENVDDCDAIICYNLKSYGNEIFKKLQNIASKLSSNNKKRVTVGYSCPKLYGKSSYDRSIQEEVRISSFKENQQTTKKLGSTPYFSPYDLAELTLSTQDEYDVYK